MPPINTSTIHNHKETKTQALHRLDQARLDQHYEIKRLDAELERTKLKDYDLQKSIDEINRYTSLKKSVEYGLYQYSKYLGNKLDVFV